ncbi:MAG: cytochrome C [Candidatus Sumerlaeota bacterium]|nr:cytochrome C [Candidatus Sumerlaeota bacterium]
MRASFFFPFGRIATALLATALAFGAQETERRKEQADDADLAYLLSNKDLQALGERLFFDKELSTPPGQACAACHGPEVGWTGPDEQVNKTGVYPGAIHERFGNRKPNSAAYATLSPLFRAKWEKGKVQFLGGNFWDGRATGYKLGNPAADQAQGPFLNPVEQNNPDAKAIVERVCRSDYAPLFKKVATEVWAIPDVSKEPDVDLAYGIVGIAIAAFENSEKVNQFSSKFDAFLKGKAALTVQEREGLKLFEGKAKCAGCHVSKRGPKGEHPLFTNFTYENLGAPRNPQNPWYKMDAEFNPDGPSWVDPGLAGFLKKTPQYAMFAPENFGKHLVPTLRNVDQRPSAGFVKAYGHNGYFKSLGGIVHFYNTRDVLPAAESVSDAKPGVNCWPKPEAPQNVNRAEVGDLKLSAEEEAAVVAFLKTLSDGYQASEGEREAHAANSGRSGKEKGAAK